MINHAQHTQSCARALHLCKLGNDLIRLHVVLNICPSCVAMNWPRDENRASFRHMVFDPLLPSNSVRSVCTHTNQDDMHPLFVWTVCIRHGVIHGSLLVAKVLNAGRSHDLLVFADCRPVHVNPHSQASCLTRNVCNSSPHGKFERTKSADVPALFPALQDWCSICSGFDFLYIRLYD